MDVFAFREELIPEYERFSRSFTESAWQISSRPPIRLSQAGVLPHPTHPVHGRISKGEGSAPRRWGLCCHDVTPDHHGIRLPWDRNCELAFVNLLRQLDADNDTSRIVERLESQHRAQSPFHPAAVLLHNVVQVLTAMNLHRVPPPEVELPVHSHVPQGARARLVAIQSDAVWLPMMLQRLAKECLRRCGATCPTEKELHSVALSVHGSIQVHPLAPHLDKRFINPPAPTHRSFESAPTPFADFGIANDPPQDCGVRNR